MKDSRFDEDMKKLLSMKLGDAEYFNWFEEGGARVVKYSDTWGLWDCPQYGGSDPQHTGEWLEEHLGEMLETIYGWS